jgi:hypothetical protein
MFEVVDDGSAPGAVVVRGTGGFAGQSAVFSGPEARSRAEAYARWLNAGAAYQRRRTDPGFKPLRAPDPGRRDADASGA